MALHNLMGELGLEETLQRIALFLERLDSTMGRTYPDTNGRMQVNVVTGTLPTLTSQSQQSGYSTAYDQYEQMMVGADYIRNRISVT